jgi:hypothetical protein
LKRLETGVGGGYSFSMATGNGTTFGAVCRVLCCALIVHLCLADGVEFASAVPISQGASQGTPQASAGSMQTTGDVSLNGMKATGEQTVYTGDTVRTTAGMAIVDLPGAGMLNIAEDSQLVFGGAGSSIGTLKYGTAELRSQAGKTPALQFGNWMVSVTAQGVARLTVGPDGAARVESVQGSVSVMPVSGGVATLLNPGQAVLVSADGVLGKVESASAAASGNPKPAGKRSHTGYIILGVAGGGGIAAAVVLATRHNTPESPSAP